MDILMNDNAIYTSLDTIIGKALIWKCVFKQKEKSDAHCYIGAVVTNQAQLVSKYLSGSQPVRGWEGCSSIMKLYEMLVLASWKYEALFQRRAHNEGSFK